MNQTVMWMDIYAGIVQLIMFSEDIRQKKMGMLKFVSFLNLQFSAIVMVFSDAAHHFFSEWVHPGMVGSFEYSDIAIILAFIAYYMMLYWFIVYVRDYIGQNKKIPRIYTRASLVLAAVFSIVLSVAVLTGIMFKIDNGIMRPGPLYLMGLLGGYSIVALVILMLKRYGEEVGLHNMVVLITFSMCPVAGVIFRVIFKIPSVIVLLFSLTMVLMHIIMRMENSERIRRQEAVITNDRIKIMISQIQPHFIFNALNSIYVLCEKDPEQAQEAVGDFSDYLRTNLDSLENADLITLEQEMEHVDTYLKLEKMRFQEQLLIEKGDFIKDIRLPVLTLQPIVENAVRHGIGRKKEGGTVSIGSYDIDSDYVVYVRDNGVGFDPDSVVGDEDEKPDEMTGKKRRHVGIKNVRERLRLMCDGRLEVISSPGNGCEVRVIIPKKRQ